MLLGVFFCFLWCQEVKLYQTVCGSVVQPLLYVTNYIQNEFVSFWLQKNTSI